MKWEYRKGNIVSRKGNVFEVRLHGEHYIEDVVTVEISNIREGAFTMSQIIGYDVYRHTLYVLGYDIQEYLIAGDA